MDTSAHDLGPSIQLSWQEDTEWEYLWLRYVWGFRPAWRGAACLLSDKSKKITKKLPQGELVSLDESGAPFVYLCGLLSSGQDVDVGMRVVPRIPQSADMLVRVVGCLSIQMRGLEPVEAPPLPDGYRGVGAAYATDHAYRFGVAHIEGLQVALPEHLNQELARPRLPQDLANDGEFITAKGKTSTYKIANVNGGLECSCPGFRFKQRCRHIESALRSMP